MSQNIVSLDSPSGPRCILAGWDPRARRYFCTVIPLGPPDGARPPPSTETFASCQELVDSLGSRGMALPDTFAQALDRDGSQDADRTVRLYHRNGALEYEVHLDDDQPAPARHRGPVGI